MRNINEEVISTMAQWEKIKHKILPPIPGVYRKAYEKYWQSRKIKRVVDDEKRIKLLDIFSKN